MIVPRVAPLPYLIFCHLLAWLALLTRLGAALHSEILVRRVAGRALMCGRPATRSRILMRV